MNLNKFNLEEYRSKILRGKLLHAGKANNVYEVLYLDDDGKSPVPIDDVLELEASDRISAGNGEKKDTVQGKGEANNLISTALFKKLDEVGVPTHYLGPGTNSCSKLVYKADPVLLEVIGRFYATGSFVRRYGCSDMMKFKEDPFIEYTYKNDEAGDPPMSREAVIACRILSARELGYVDYITEQAAYVLDEFFDDCGARLIDFKIEFGWLPNGQMAVIDEISPDTCRIVDKKTGKSLDKDVFRKGLGDVSATYAAIAARVANNVLGDDTKEAAPARQGPVPTHGYICDRDGE